MFQVYEFFGRLTISCDNQMMTIDKKIDDLALSEWIISGFRDVEESRVRDGHKPWPEYDSSLDSCDNYFKDVTPRGGIRSILLELVGENKGGGLSILDVAGQGNAFLECGDCDIDGITAVFLGDYRDSSRREMESSQGLIYIPGNILDPVTREKVRLKKYNFVFFKPVGAKRLISSPEVGFDLLTFIYASLEEVGVILMEVPEYMIANQGTDWVNDLANIEGIEVRFNYSHPHSSAHLLLRKKAGGPEDIESILEGSSKSQSRMKALDTLSWN